MTLKQNFFYFFPVLFCFCLPFGSIVLGALVVFWIIASFFNLNVSQLKRGFSNPKLILFYLFFFLTVISALISSNKAEAGFSVEVKLTFFFFPYLFFCFEWPVEILKRCVISFVSGCFFASLYLIFRAFLFAADGQPEYFFYTLFSYFIHVSYFTMYLVLAIIFVVLFYNDWFKTQKTVIYSSYFFIAIFVTTIFLCSSKLGMLSFFISMPLLLAYKYKERLSLKNILIFCGTIIFLFVVLVKIFPESFNRFNSLSKVSLEKIDKTSSESTAVRLLVWGEAITIIKSNFIFGTNVGDANDKLYEAYERNGLTGAYEHKFNAHNQFFQTFIGIGLIGFLLLIAMTFGSLGRAIKNKNFLSAIFCLLIILNFMVESMLQTSAGVLFFAFFACFFDKITENELRKDASYKTNDDTTS
ncbi:O-antigen ligase family protein [Aurantibacillus circumpalustris]|uniref:O-antigen ligase family protein n=1 Tax=Aurantibacillus circumpalustris TaxID=3036359 RepID=UPI00295AB32E|nr:O-antigen ligase family protein [Aurantibacillus circumpalustris]